MKNLILLFLVCPLIVYSQDYPRIDTLSFGTGIKEAYLYRKYESESNEKLIEKYLFNEQGQHTFSYYGYNTSMQYKYTYKFENQKLTTYTKLAHSTLVEDIDWLNVDKIDSSMFENINPEKLDWEQNTVYHEHVEISYDSKGKVKQYLCFDQDFVSKELYLDKEISLIYNPIGNLEKRICNQIDNPNVFKFQAFKSNSFELNDSIKIISNNIEEKVYYYNGDSTKINYLLNGKLTGIEYQVYYPKLKEKHFTVFSMNNDTLSIRVETYNDKGLIQSKKKILQEGKNGFGYSLDSSAGDDYVYEYDEFDRLISITCFYNGKHFYKDTYKF